MAFDGKDEIIAAQWGIWPTFVSLHKSRFEPILAPKSCFLCIFVDFYRQNVSALMNGVTQNRPTFFKAQKYALQIWIMKKFGKFFEKFGAKIKKITFLEPKIWIFGVKINFSSVLKLKIYNFCAFLGAKI